MGLWTGFSLMSVIEFGYWIAIIFCKEPAALDTKSWHE